MSDPTLGELDVTTAHGGQLRIVRADREIRCSTQMLSTLGLNPNVNVDEHQLVIKAVNGMVVYRLDRQAEADGLVPAKMMGRGITSTTRSTRRFELHRDQDVTGVSGVGVVADGVVFPDGVVALRWRGGFPTSVVFHDRGVEAVEQIHGHNGATRIAWLD